MSEVSRAELARLLKAVVPSIMKSQKETGPHALQCFGAELSSGVAFAERVELIDSRLSPREKPALEQLARELRSAKEAARQLDLTGVLTVDLDDNQRSRDWPPFARYFYAIEAQEQVAAEIPPFRIRAWGFTSQRPSTPFSPLALRVTVDRLGGALHAEYDPPSLETFAKAMRRGAMTQALQALSAASEIEALALWHYDEVKRRFRTLMTHGFGQAHLAVPVESAASEERRGIIAQLRPTRALVVYDALDRDAWQPPWAGKWGPWDRDLFNKKAWRSCILAPVICDGRLLGALGAYSQNAAASLLAHSSMLRNAAALCSDAILVQREEKVIAALASQYDEELLTANVSLSALSLSHDIIHYYRSITTHIDNADLYLEGKQVPPARNELREVKRTMESTAPAINTMLKLATEARASRSTKVSAVTEDVASVMSELRILLRSILPHASEDARVEPDRISVQLAGKPRALAVPPLALERIVVNLCVNAAQWNASEVDVTGHFDRSKDFQVVVRDNGRGIPAIQIDRIFDRFYSGREGSGLGLYVVKSLATRAGGSVYVQSFDGSDDAPRGTVVTVTLPVVSEP